MFNMKYSGACAGYTKHKRSAEYLTLNYKEENQVSQTFHHYPTINNMVFQEKDSYQSGKIFMLF